MADNYKIVLSLNDKTLDSLFDSNQTLRAFKGVKANKGGGKSTVWFTTDNLSQKVTINWSEQYGGHAVRDQLKAGITIDASTVDPMDLGDLMTLYDSGKSVVTTDGSDGNIDFKNAGKKEWIVGMGEEVKGELSPTCAFTLYGTNSSVLVMPYEQVLLVFESDQTDTGTVVEETISSSIILTFTGKERSREVSFDIDDGWDAGGASWAKINLSSINIANELIHKM